MINASRNNDILDDEIRIIAGKVDPSNESKPQNDGKKPKFPRWGWVALFLSAVALAICLGWVLRSANEDDKDGADTAVADTLAIAADAPSDWESGMGAEAYVSIRDTVVDSRKLTILKPENATARLCLGDSLLDAVGSADGPVLMVQAAAVRLDNEQIVGSFVLAGELKSRGKSMSGFCAIIGGEIVVGMAETTPLLEKATEENGYFFRQFPLLYEGEIIENKLKNEAQRKALATLDGDVVVVLSHDRLSFHDFSQTLADLGVKNAINLIGSTSYLKARLQDGRVYAFGKREVDIYPNTNYIIWQ